MIAEFREATRDDVPAVLDLLRDDVLGAGREGGNVDYFGAFDAMQKEGNNRLIVGVLGDKIVATYQLTLISGLSLRATRRAQLESVRVSSQLRGSGLGQQLIADAEQRAQAAGCRLMQLTMNTSRTDAHRFYEANGFSPTHVGFKRNLG